MTLFDEIRSRKKELLAIARQYGASNLRIFGSVQRNQDGQLSDIDILVALEPGRTLLDLVALEQDLSDFLGRKVDVVVEGGLSPHIGPRILAEAVPL